MSDEEDEDVQQEAIDKLRSLMSRMPNGDMCNSDIKRTLKTLSGQLKETDELYPILKRKLVGSSFDAKHIKKLLQVSTSTAKRINATGKDFNLKDKVQKLKEIHKKDLMKYLALEFAAGDFCYAPTFEFFYGAIPLEGLVVRERKRRARIDTSEQAATQTRARERDLRADCDQDSTPHEVEAIFKRVKDLTKNSSRGADFLPAVVDAESFSRTVENLFHFSFLVREGRVGIKKGGDDDPVMKAIDESDESKHWNQSVMSFSMADYKEWTKKR